MRVRHDDLTNPFEPASTQRSGSARGLWVSVGLTALQHFKARVAPQLERGLWRVTSPELYVALAVIAWLGVIFAPELRARYIKAHPELQQRVAARVATAWGQQPRVRLELELNAAGGEVPIALRPLRPAGVIYLTGSGGEGCVGALIKPRVVLSSARCVERVRPDLAAWGPRTGEEWIQVTAVEPGPRGELALLKLSRVAPVPPMRIAREAQASSSRAGSPLKGEQRRPHPALQSGLEVARQALGHGASSVEALSTRDELNVVLYLPVSPRRESGWGRGHADVAHVKASLWVPQRSARSPEARSEALAALSSHQSGALIVSRSRALEGVITAQGVVSVAGRRSWLEETSEALSARRVDPSVRGASGVRGARPLASRSL